MYGVGLLLAYPVVLWEARENLKKIVYGGDMRKQHTSSGSYSPIAEEFTVLDETISSYDEHATAITEPPSAKESFRVHAIFSVFLVLLTATLGAVVTNLEVVFGLIGSTCTPVIAYVLPSLVYLRSGAATKFDDETLPRVSLIIGIALVPFGLTVWILSRLDIM
jgi:Transmembrane amino acid transporter protein